MSVLTEETHAALCGMLAVSFLNSISGQMITGPEKAKRGAIDQSKAILDGGVSVFAQKTSHFCNSVHYISSLSSCWRW